MNADEIFKQGNYWYNRGNLDKANQLWRKAADAGHADAMYNLELFLSEQGREVEAEQWRRKAAEAERQDRRRPRAWHEGSGMHQKWFFGWKWEKSGGNLNARRYAAEMGEKAADLADEVARGNQDFGPH